MSLNDVSDEYLKKEDYLSAGKLAIEILKHTKPRSNDEDIQLSRNKAQGDYCESIKSLENQGRDFAKLLLEKAHKAALDSHKGRLRGGKKRL